MFLTLQTCISYQLYFFTFFQNLKFELRQNISLAYEINNSNTDKATTKKKKSKFWA